MEHEAQRRCPECGINIGPGDRSCPSCGSGLPAGSEAPHPETSDRPALKNAGKAVLGVVVLLALVLLIAWLV